MAALLPDIPQVETIILQMTNQFRAEQGLGRVVPNAKLAAAARYFAGYLARTGKFAHEADGRKPADRAKSHGYKFCQVAENLALHMDSRGFRSKQLAGKAILGWKNSPGHRRNMLLPHVTEIGIAVAKDPGKPQYISVQLFGRPASARFDYNVFNFSTLKVAYTDGADAYAVAPNEMATHEVCTPITVTFKSAVSGRGKQLPIKGSFAARRGDIFTLSDNRDGGVRIERGGK